MANDTLRRWWLGLDRPGWRNFAVAMALLSLAMLLALASAAAAERARVWTAGVLALAALGLAAWVAVRIVPQLARRTGLGWLRFRVRYRLTREGVVYLVLVFVIILAALNTGNNLLFMILASLLAGILVSGVLSRMTLTGIELRFDAPEHIFAGQPVMAAVELRNHKQMLPSFSLRVGHDPKSKAPAILAQPVYFPYIPRRQSARQSVELRFPRRGLYRQESFAVSTRFPFGFLEKTRPVEMPREILVYPAVEPTEEFYEALPMLTGERESYQRGRGHDLYSIREYVPTDSARFVDWKASARTGSLKVREFTREDERRVLLALDPYLNAAGGASAAELEEKFDRAVTLAACLAWHFYKTGAEMGFRTAGLALPMAPAAEIIYDVLGALALVAPLPAERDGRFLAELAESSEHFQIVLTSRPHGSIPTSLWTTAWMVFFDSL
jgi:uncharacterized protein (DUF58 family)